LHYIGLLLVNIHISLQIINSTINGLSWPTLMILLGGQRAIWNVISVWLVKVIQSKFHQKVRRMKMILKR